MSYKSFINGLGAIVVVICIMGLLWSITNYNSVFGIDHKREQVELRLSVKVDSTGQMDGITKAQLDSLITKIEIHEHLLQDKYEHILEQKEIFNDVLALGGMLLAVVLSVFGFFGYKSLNTIEDRAKEQAEQASEGFFKNQFDTYKKDTKSELEGGLNIIVKEKIEKDLSDYKNVVKNFIDAKVKTATLQYGNEVAELNTLNENIKLSLDNLDGKVSRLTDRIVKVENAYPLQEGRRTLASAGRKIGYNFEKSISNPEEEK